MQKEHQRKHHRNCPEIWNKGECTCVKEKEGLCNYFIMPGIGGDTTCANEKPCKIHGEFKELEHVFFADEMNIEKECKVCGIMSFSHQHFKGDKPRDFVRLPDNVMHASKEEECNCKEMSCTEGCTNNHTHKHFFCEKCEPVVLASKEESCEICGNKYNHHTPVLEEPEELGRFIM